MEDCCVRGGGWGGGGGSRLLARCSSNAGNGSKMKTNGRQEKIGKGDAVDPR